MSLGNLFPLPPLPFREPLVHSQHICRKQPSLVTACSSSDLQNRVRLVRSVCGQHRQQQLLLLLDDLFGRRLDLLLSHLQQVRVLVRSRVLQHLLQRVQIADQGLNLAVAVGDLGQVVELLGLLGKFGRGYVLDLASGLTVELFEELIVQLLHGLKFRLHLVEHGVVEGDLIGGRFFRARE